MSNQVLQQIVIGIVVAVSSAGITGGINKAITEKVNLWLVIASFLSVVVIFGIYISHIVPDYVAIIAGPLDIAIFAILLFIASRRNEQFPCIKWYVTEENKGPNTVDWNQQKLVG